MKIQEYNNVMAIGDLGSARNLLSNVRDMDSDLDDSELVDIVRILTNLITQLEQHIEVEQ